MTTPLQPEDYRIQTMDDVSPPWWNLGHTSWFFARNVLEAAGEYKIQDREFDYVLNSYYESLGDRVPRSDRGKLTRPTTEEILRYRKSIDSSDSRMANVILNASEETFRKLESIIIIGLHHEQQHQELFVTEIKHILARLSPNLRRPYHERQLDTRTIEVPKAQFVPFEAGLYDFGNIEEEWCWDCELPVHKYYLCDFKLMNRLVTNREYMEFIDDGGYKNPLLWFANGWEKIKEKGWEAPLYWEKKDGQWMVWTLSGMQKVDLDEPVCHVSFYEAAAFAEWTSQTYERWKGARLPTEREWEHAARKSALRKDGNFFEAGRFHPAPASDRESSLVQMFGDVWEWTSNHFEPYPGYKPFQGALVEYNSKFMNNQRVLRGGSCATPKDEIRISNRNFWSPLTRFQFTGIRLAWDL
ncbi:ergothioneine biosynthesis protein EgtB [Acidobacteria bacterium AH-259-O06]|nr:ergothioneine biosynthesis protein EgtB [Acidobacteria bacterium AH-259-L09]MDA2929151.1 ergothioneine biosynthesis protein EgtB [Acidobacteria bacterium AH-259-O06]